MVHRFDGRKHMLKKTTLFFYLLCFFVPNLAVSAMDSGDIAHDFSPFVRIYKDGRVERLMGTQTVPAGADDKTGVVSKDVVFSPELGVSARLYLPENFAAVGISGDASERLPVLVYYHGGGFVIETASSPTYHNYLNSLVAGAQIAVVSVDYRRAPEHPLPAAYDDSWAALKWVASHSSGNGPERWLNDHADLTRLFVGGDSAGANIAHRMGVIAGVEEIGGGVRIKGMVLVHPYFWGEEPVGGESGEPDKRMVAAGLWRFAYPKTVGSDDPWINPEKDPVGLEKMGCGKVLICVAEKDTLKHRGWHYYEVLKKSGWVGSVEIMESDGVDHVFHLISDPTAERAVAMLNKVSSFVNQA